MISLQVPSQHVSSYATSIPHPSVQSSYDYTSSVCNPQTWAPVAPYPSPPMSSSPTATAHYANHADRAFDPSYTRIRSQPTMAPDIQFWPQPTGYHQNVYPQQSQQQMSTLTLHHPRSPRMQQSIQAPYLPPLPTHAPQPYPTFAQSQQAREYVPQPGPYQSVAPQSLVPSMALLPSGKQAPNKPVRRTKQHVQTACFNCKKAHLSCDVGRPCNRCKQSGKQDTCYNVAHKRRGRPRLRDTFGNKIIRQPDQQATGVVLANGIGPPVPAPRRRSDPSLRVLKSQVDMSHADLGSPDTFMGPSGSSTVAFTRSFPPNSPVAFLDLDLTVVRTNQFFNGLFGLEPDHRGRNLDGFIDPNDRASLQEVRNKLREEKDAKDPTYLAPLRMNGARDAADNIPTVESMDLSRITNQGFQERVADLRFHGAGGTIDSVRINIRLAKAEVFFAVLVLPPASEIVPAYGQQASRPVAPPASSYAFHNGYSSQAYGVSDSSGLTHGASVSNSAPASPYYTFAPSMQPANSTRISAAQQPYDSGMYFTANMQSPPLYGYASQSGVATQAMTGAAEPRQFQAYQQEPPQMQMQFPTSGQPQLLQPSYQLPPINGQGERPRSTGAPAPGVVQMRQDMFGRDHQQAYMHMRDDGQPHVDGSHGLPGSSEKGRGPHLTNLLQ